MKRTVRFGSIALGILASTLLSGCADLGSEINDASLLAYWNQNPSAIECGNALDCVAFADNLQDFELLVNQKRAAGMELVRLDAYRKKSERLYAGAWKTVPPGSGPHLYSTSLTPSQFVTQQAQATANGLRLVHVSVWRDDPHRRIAAIWEPGTTAAPGQPVEAVEVGIDWATLTEKDAVYRGRGLFLDDLEVDPKPPAGEAPFLIAVWRPGSVATEVLPGGPCSIEKHPIEPDAMVTDDVPPCDLPAPPGDDALGGCSVFDTIRARSLAGFHPSDFEPYVQDGEQKLAVLLQARGDRDWLMVPGSWHAVHCRHQLLGIDPVLGEPPTAVGLLDFDLVGLGAPRLFPGTHNGLVHDGGTSGPPGGASAGAPGETTTELATASLAAASSPPD